MQDRSAVIFEAGTVTREYNGVTVSVHADRDITVGDWAEPFERFFAEVERDKEERNAGQKRNAPSRQARSA